MSAQVNQYLLVVHVKQVFPKLWIWYSRPYFIRIYMKCLFCLFVLNGMSKQDGLETKGGFLIMGLADGVISVNRVGCWKVYRSSLVLSMSVLPSFLQPALPSGPLLSLLLLLWLSSSCHRGWKHLSQTCSFSPRELFLPVNRSSLRAEM